jgi:ABC-2 type transport system ATP-binding protein
MDNNVIEVKNITKVFNPFPLRKRERGIGLWLANTMRLRRIKEKEIKALNNVSFSVQRGETFAIMGPNGAGKTTLIKILSGLLYPTAGTGVVESLNIWKNHNTIKQKISFVSASFWMGLEWQFTVMENILQYATLMGITETTAKKNLQLYGKYFGVNFYDKKVPELSAGMRQVVSIIRGFIVDRPIIYLDEPAVSLDAEKRKILSEVVKNEAKNGKTILISSHEFTDLDLYKPRALLLYKGKVIGIGRAEDLLKTKNIIPYEMELSTFNNDIEKELIEKDIIYGKIPKELIELDRVFRVRMLVKYGKVNDLIKTLVENNVKIFSMKRKEISLKDAYLYRMKDEILH